MIMKKITLWSASILLIGATAALNAKPNVEKPEMFKEILKKAAGAPGPFANEKLENFPKGYFLIPFNLPYLVGLSLHHPRSSELGLSDEQIRAITQIKESTVPVVLKKARRIKDLELQLLEEMERHPDDPKRLTPLVEEIAQKRTELTKEHLKCIVAVRKILTDKQYETIKMWNK